MRTWMQFGNTNKINKEYLMVVSPKSRMFVRYEFDESRASQWVVVWGNGVVYQAYATAKEAEWYVNTLRKMCDGFHQFVLAYDQGNKS